MDELTLLTHNNCLHQISTSDVILTVLRRLSRVSIPVWLIILSDKLLIIILILTRYSPIRHWKHQFPSNLHIYS
ncbi:hypothetical protein MIMGU_mgv1a026477mg, partial [Erythranthe guttata]